MSPNKKVFLLRHGERADHADPTWVRTAPEPFDPPLTEQGRRQIASAVERIAAANIQHIVSSPLRRTVESAGIAAALLNNDFDVDDGLVEWQNPEWFSQLTTGNHLWLSGTPGWSGRRRRSQLPQYPESAQQAAERCDAAARVLVAEFTSVLIIGHENGVVGIARGLGCGSIEHIEPGGLLCLELHRATLGDELTPMQGGVRTA